MREYRLVAGMTAKQLGSMLHLSESSITIMKPESADHHRIRS